MDPKEWNIYLVTLEVLDEEDALRRIDLLNSSVYRILSSDDTRLEKVVSSDYSAGTMKMLIRSPQGDPNIVVGQVRVKIEFQSAE